MRQVRSLGVTLTELVIVLVVGGIIFLSTPPLVLHGVKTFVFLPRALATNDVAGEVLHQMIEGGFSTLPGLTTVRGLRFAVPGGGQAAIWNTSPSQLGYRTSDTQCVVIRLTAGVVTRTVSTVTSGAPCTTSGGTAENIPYVTPANLQIIATAPAIFRYYNQSGIENALPIRRVDIAFVAQTGNGVFDQGQASEQIASAVAIRVP